MIIFLTASSDNYITNKVVDSEYRTGSNVGRSSTLDIFKLYEESTIPGSLEISKVLISFDVSSLGHLTSSFFRTSEISANLRLKSVNAGNPTPSNFILSCFPLSRNFREGYGRDVISFTDTDESNYVYRVSGSEWVAQGCSAGGPSGSNSDYYTSANFGSGVISLESKQEFIEGNEDALFDVTTVVSATLSGLLDDNGFVISFTGSQENDSITRFVKRFASRHVKNKVLQPILEIKFDDSKIDYHSNMRFGDESSIYLVSTTGNNFINKLGEELTGSNCVSVSLNTGSYSISFPGSKDDMGGLRDSSYVAYVTVPRNDLGIVSGSSTLSEHITASGSIQFDEIWSDASGDVTLYEGKITISSNSSSKSTSNRSRILCRCDGPNQILRDDIFLVRCSFFDLSLEDRAVKIPIQRETIKITNGYYRLKDLMSNEIIYDFSEHTKISLDSTGNYFYVHPSCLREGRTLSFEFKIEYGGSNHIISDSNYTMHLRD